MADNDRPLGVLDTNRTFITDPTHPVGRRVFDFAGRHDEVPWFGGGFLVMLLGVGLATVIPDPVGAVVVAVSVLVLFPATLLENLESEKVCPRCKFIQQDRTNYCPSCGYTFRPVLGDTITIEGDLAATTSVGPIRIDPHPDEQRDPAAEEVAGP